MFLRCALAASRCLKSSAAIASTPITSPMPARSSVMNARNGHIPKRAHCVNCSDGRVYFVSPAKLLDGVVIHAAAFVANPRFAPALIK